MNTTKSTSTLVIPSSPGVYCLWSYLKGKAIYVGSTMNLARRKRQHKWSSKNGFHTSQKLTDHCQAHGDSDIAFVPLLYCQPEELELRESEMIEALKTQVQHGGCNSRIDVESNAGITCEKPAWNKGQSMSEEYRKRTSEATKQAMQNPEIRAKISAGKVGKPSPKKGIKTGIAAHNVRPVSVCRKDGTAIGNYPSIREAAEATGVQMQTIWAAATNKRTTKSGYVFSFQ